MEANQVIDLYQLLKANGIQIIIDGGWAVDALMGRQTRKHEDLDIAMCHKDVPKMRKVLAQIRFSDFPTKDASECNFVLADDYGNKLDIHTYLFDAVGNNVWGIAYQQADFGGKGTINGQEVECINPISLVQFHTGYAIDENDYHDVKLLCEKFSLAMPIDYAHFPDQQH